MNAEGRIRTAARWIQGANSALNGAAAPPGAGYGRSRWQRATEANRAVEYAVKGMVIAIEGRVEPRHSMRQLAYHLRGRGEDFAIELLDELEPEKGRTPTAYHEFEDPERKELSDERLDRIMRAAAALVDHCEKRVRELAREQRIEVDLRPPADDWQPAAGMRREAAPTVASGNEAHEPAEAPDPAEESAGAERRRDGTARPGEDKGNADGGR